MEPGRPERTLTIRHLVICAAVGAAVTVMVGVGTVIAVKLIIAKAMTGGGGVGTNTPIVVRGGAMTFRSTVAWKPIPNGGGQPGYCIDGADLTYVGLEDVIPKSASPSIPIPISLYNLSADWKLELYGRTEGAKPQKQSSTGITVYAYQNL